MHGQTFETRFIRQKCKKKQQLTCVCISLCTTVIHNIAHRSTDYIPSYPPDRHQSSDAVYWKGGGWWDRQTDRRTADNTLSAVDAVRVIIYHIINGPQKTCGTKSVTESVIQIS